MLAAKNSQLAKASLTADSVPTACILSLLQRASRETRDLDLGCSVDRVHISELTPLRFSTEYVQRNKPVVITGALETWPAMRLWDERYLESHPAGEAVVTVDVTPNGRSDAITIVADPSTGELHRWFVTPHERQVTLKDFFQLMRKTRAVERAETAGGRLGPREVPYMQHQNNNLKQELGQLMEDLGPGLSWADSVFGGPPEATNIWIGDGRSVTSFHKDHYENLYAVLRGTKVFTLLPPCDVYRMYLSRYPAAVFTPRRDVTPGATFGELSCAPSQHPAAHDAGGRGSGGNGSGVGGGRSAATAASASSHPVAGTRQHTIASAQSISAAAVHADDPERMVAVMQEPGYQVLWSAVDTTVIDLATRAAQPLFYGASERRVRGGAGGGGTCWDSGDDDEAPNSVTVEEEEEEEEDAWMTAGGAPLIVEVGPGEALYLPSLWFHQVEQYCEGGWGRDGGKPGGQGPGRGDPSGSGSRSSGWGRSGTEQRPMEQAGQQREGPEDENYVIAVNFWYDMKYDGRYSAFKLTEGLATMLGLADEAPGLKLVGEGDLASDT